MRNDNKKLINNNFKTIEEIEDILNNNIKILKYINTLISAPILFKRYYLFLNFNG